MENQIKPEEELKSLETTEKKPPDDKMLSLSIVLAALIIAGTWVYTSGYNSTSFKKLGGNVLPKDGGSLTQLEDAVLPLEGIVLPVKWGDLGLKLVSAGVIDPKKFKDIYKNRNNLSGEIQKYLEGRDDERIKINDSNSGLWLNLFWALGLGNKNSILTQGPLSDPRYGGAGNFASTGGWTIANGDILDHLARHPFIILTKEQQELVERVSKNIYRPCCNNSTYFPDCNHGMAMLGLLELMASRGISEEEMYKIALQVNSYWFPDTYITVAKYFKSRGREWNRVNPREILGKDYSSATGYQRILTEVEPPQNRSGGGCGV